MNPAYAVLPGLEPGGIATTIHGRRAWDAMGGGRDLTEFEAHCLDYLHEFPPIGSEIRM